MRGEKLVGILVRSEAPIPGHPASPTFIYVSRGEGSLQADAAYPLRPQTLLEIPPGLGFTLRAKPGAPLAVIAFRPET